MHRFFWNRRKNRIYRPISAANSLWNVSTVGNISEQIRYPAIPGNLSFITADSIDDNERQVYDIAKPAINATKIRVYLYGQRLGFAVPPDITVDIKVGAVTATPQNAGFNSDTTLSWKTVEFTGSWTAADFATAFQVGLTAGVMGNLQFINIDVVYCEVF